MSSIGQKDLKRPCWADVRDDSSDEDVPKTEVPSLQLQDCSYELPSSQGGNLPDMMSHALSTVQGANVLAPCDSTRGTSLCNENDVEPCTNEPAEQVASAAAPRRRGAKREAPRSFPELADIDEARREAKRLAIVAVIKETPAYKDMKADFERQQPHIGQKPQTPDAMDRTISKRNWELLVRQWKQVVNDL